jgi:integrase
MQDINVQVILWLSSGNEERSGSIGSAILTADLARRRKPQKADSPRRKKRSWPRLMQNLKINYFGFSEDGNENVEIHFNQWLKVYKKPYVKPITYTVQERNVRLNIWPRFGHYRLKDLTWTKYQKWINNKRENPLQKIKIPKNTEKNDKVSFFTNEQLNAFLSATKTPMKGAKYQASIQYTALFTLLARTGIRIGEALALTWDDIDFENKTLTVNKTLVYPLNSTPYLSTPKSKSSDRVVKLDDSTTKLMRSHRKNQKEVILQYQNYQSSIDNIIFHQQDGRWLRTNVVREYFMEICKRVNPHMRCAIPTLYISWRPA